MLAPAYRMFGYQRNRSLQSDEAYKKVGWVYRCVRVLATNAQQVPVYAVRRYNGRAHGRIERLPDAHALSRLLAKPNPEDDFSSIIEQTVTHQQLRGECLWELEIPGDMSNGRPTAINVIPPKFLHRVNVKDAMYDSFDIRVQSEKFTIPGDQGIFFKLFNPEDPFRGLAPMEAAYQAADTDYAAKIFNANFFSNGAVPSLAITFDKNVNGGRLTKEVRDRLREEFKVLHSGVNNAWGVAVLGPGQSIQKVGAELQDMAFDKLRQWDKDEILATFGVPPLLVSDVANANRANAVEQRHMFWEDTMIPLIDDVASMVNRKLAPRFGDNVGVVFDYSQIPAIRAVKRQDSDAVLPMIEAGVLTINEVRTEMLHKPPVAWGDQWWHNAQDAPTGMQGVDADPVRNDIEPAAVKRMLGEWKNAIISRLRDGAKTPTEAFPAAHEAKKASKKFGIPHQAAFELARALWLQLSLEWDEINPADGVTMLFDRTVKKLPEGKTDTRELVQ